MPALFRDDDQNSLSDPAGLHGDYASAGIIAATTGAAVVEVSLPSDFLAAANQTEVGKSVMVRIANGSANDALYAFGPAGATFTGNSNMALIPKQWIEFARVDPSVDKSFYHLQVTGASTIQIMLLK